MKKFILFLLTAMLAVTSVSCSSNQSVSDNTTAEANAADVFDIATEAISDEKIKDDLPELDYKGYEFKVYSRYAPLYFDGPLDTEEETGEVVNDAIFQRNRKVEERLNIIFTEVLYDNAVDQDAPRKLLMAADDTYDMFMARGLRAFNYAMDGMLNGFGTLEYVNLDKPYWDQSLNDALNLHDRQYFAVGAFNLSSYEFTHMLLFNKQMAESLNLDDPYKLVQDGTWTYDAFHDMAKTAIADVNGDGVFDVNDRFGLASHPAQVLPSFWIGADTLSIDRDSDGKLYYAAQENPKFSEVYVRIFEIARDGNMWHPFEMTVGDVNLISEPFINGRGLFHDVDCHRIPALRNMDTDFGVIPFPKYTEEQEKYFTRIEGAELPCLPKTNTNFERTGAVIEALASESLYTVLPAYYEVALQTKYSRDKVSSEMLDLIFSNRVYDYGDTILTSEMRDGVFQRKFYNNDRDIASTLETMRSSVLSKLEKLNGDY